MDTYRQWGALPTCFPTRLHQATPDQIQYGRMYTSHQSVPPGLPIDRIPTATTTAENNPLTSSYRSLMGGLTWLSISTRPDIAVAHKLLSRHITNPSPGHMEAAKHVLRYLRGTTENGIAFMENPADNLIHGYITWPNKVPPPDNDGSSTYTD